MLRGAARPPGRVRSSCCAVTWTPFRSAEEVDVDYASERPGLMHACGHDLHVAALVGAARILDELRDQLVGDVVLMFQPAEEGPGGAEPMIDEGLLEAAGRPVDAAYAVHVYSSDHPRGVWFGRPGALMAAADEVRVRVRGLGGHGSAPHRTKDPVPAACEIVLALQTAVTRRFDVFDPVVLTVGGSPPGRRTTSSRTTRCSRRRCGPSPSRAASSPTR